MKQTFLLLIMIGATILLLLLPTPHRTSEPRRALKEVALPDNAAQRQNADRQLTDKHKERIARRTARQAEYEQAIDSAILARSYRFMPQTMQVEPAGAPHIINNVAFELLVQPDFVEVNLPYMRGIMPPYQMTVLNTIVNSVQGYQTVQTDNGWEITFSSWLYEPNNYQFALSVTPTTGYAQLSISNTFYATVSYDGQLLKSY